MSKVTKFGGVVLENSENEKVRDIFFFGNGNRDLPEIFVSEGLNSKRQIIKIYNYEIL